MTTLPPDDELYAAAAALLGEQVSPAHAGDLFVVAISDRRADPPLRIVGHPQPASAAIAAAAALGESLVRGGAGEAGVTILPWEPLDAPPAADERARRRAQDAARDRALESSRAQGQLDPHWYRMS